LLQEAPPLSKSAIADTVAAVFSAPEFNPQKGFGLPSLFWWTKYLDFSLHPRIAWALAAAIVAILAIIGITVYVRRRLLDRGRSIAAGATRSGTRGRDPWSHAQVLASAGDFTGAAHALYLALLGNLATRDLLRLHPSKTMGDYLRELRRRPSAPVQTMHEFTRTYELVAYGLRACDADRYARLRALATRMIDPHG
jgi:hypothetical protein